MVKKRRGMVGFTTVRAVPACYLLSGE